MKKNLLSLLLSLLCLTAMQAQDLQARQPAPEQTSTHPSMHGNLSPDMRYRDYKRLYNPKDYVRMPGDRHSPAVSGVCSWLIPGLGKLLIKKQGARKVRNPQTGEEFKKPACKVAKFRLAKVAKDALVPPKVKK